MPGVLQGKVAIVTGGGSGLGAATVDLFVKEGASVVIADYQTEGGEKRAGASKGEVKFIRCDVTKESDIAATMAFAAKSFGGIDILYNNAGAAGELAPIAEMPAEGWDATFALLPRAAMLGMKHAIPLLKARGGGSIISTASIAGIRPGISTAAYSVAKAAVRFLSQMAAMEFAPFNVRVNSICPGIVPTGAMAGMFGFPAASMSKAVPLVEKIFAGAQPLQRAGRPDDIAQAALFLASDASSWVTGQEFIVDGGMMMVGPGTLSMSQPGSVVNQLADLGVKLREEFPG